MKLIRRLSTVDPSESVKFAQYKWWNPRTALHPFSDIRIEYMKNRLGLKSFNGLRILDIGCGGGIMTERLARLGGQVTGIDPSQEAIDVAEAHLPRVLRSRVQYQNCEVTDVKDTFDVVIASEVIEHVTDPRQFVSEVTEKVADNGSLFMTTVSRTMESWVLGIVVSEYVLGIVEPGTHQWEKFVNPEELTEMCRDAGIEVMDRQGWILNPVSFKASFTNYEKLGYLFHCLKNKTA